MSRSQLVAEHLPLLRRYARALTGNQASGDAYVAAMLETLLQDLLSQSESSMVRGGVNMSLQVAPNLPQIMADKDQVQRVLSSVLANARKFQNDGRVFVALRELAPEAGASMRFLELTVSYHGPKLAASDVQKVLDLFYPIDQRETGSEVLPCVGLGLSFCQILVERQGGKLTFDADESGASRIRALLPVASVSDTLS